MHSKSNQFQPRTCQTLQWWSLQSLAFLQRDCCNVLVSTFEAQAMKATDPNRTHGNIDAQLSLFGSRNLKKMTPSSETHCTHPSVQTFMCLKSGPALLCRVALLSYVTASSMESTISIKSAGLTAKCLSMKLKSVFPSVRNCVPLLQCKGFVMNPTVVSM